MKPYLFIILKIIFFSKKNFFRPNSSKILIFDAAGSELLIKIFKFKNYQILHTRFEVINLFILIKVLFRFKANLLDYYIEYIKAVNPLLIITYIDNNIKFYELKNYFTKKKFISIQNGLRVRSYRGSFFYILRKQNHKLIHKKRYSCDFFFVSNRFIAKEYSKYINSKFIVSGFLRNNLFKVSNTKFKKSILFVSQYRPKNQLLKELGYETELKILPLIFHFCKNNKMQFNILPSSINISDLKYEKIYYENILNSRNFNIIKKKKLADTYKAINDYENIIFIDSTLGYEAISRKKKVIIFSLRKTRNISDYFGWPQKKYQQKIKFINCTNYNKKNIYKIMNNVISCNQRTWNKKFFPYLKQFIKYDYENKIIKKKINEIIPH
jgi:surface carbohydrate biosynthesis protein